MLQQAASRAIGIVPDVLGNCVPAPSGTLSNSQVTRWSILMLLMAPNRQGDACMMTEPRLEDRGAQHYVGIRTEATLQEMGAGLIPRLLGEVLAWLEKQGVAAAGAPFIRYHVIDMESKLDIELGVPVATTLAGDGASPPAFFRPAGMRHSSTPGLRTEYRRIRRCWTGERSRVSGGTPMLQRTATGSAHGSSPTSPTRTTSRIRRNGKPRSRSGWRIVNLGRAVCRRRRR